MTSILSQSNSYDYRKYYTLEPKVIPFIGTYEIVDKYKNIHIFVKTSKNDTLRVEFLNSKSTSNNDANEYTTYQEYSVNNTESDFIILPKMKYFRIKITSTDTYDSTDIRVYNTFFTDSQVLNSDSSGNPKITTSFDPSMLDSSGHLIFSTENPQTITFNSTNIDAFGRLRISDTFTVFEATNLYNKSDKFSEYINASGTITYNANTSTVSLNAINESRVMRESKSIFLYQPGKSLLILNSFVMSPAQPDLSQRVGYFNSDNGIFLDLSGSTLYMCKRSYIYGSVVNTYIAQSNWNTNTLNTLDITKAQIFWVDIEWLGVGSVRTGFIINGQYVVCHIFNHANVIDSVYMTSANLPIRYEINKSSSGSATLKQICSTVISEGGYQEVSIIRHIGSGTSTLSLGGSPLVEIPAIAIRLRSTKINSLVIPSELDAIVTTNNNVYFRILLNPTISVLSWTPYVDYVGDTTNSSVEYALHTHISSFTNGHVLNAGYILAKNNIRLASATDFNLQLGRSINASTPDTTSTYTSDILLITFKGFSTNQAVAYTLGWFEI
jgi:hypothetical protein